MAKLPDLVARIRVDTSQLDRATGQVKASTGSMSKGFARLGTAAKLGLAGAGLALAKFGKGALDAAGAAQKVEAQTAAVLKSTGGAANVTAKQVARLTKSLQNLSGVEDEAIQEGANMLLTFTKIRNEVGKGNDIFNQATKAALDMSIAQGTDAKTAALQLGKALQDPVKGITALTRVGVAFTSEQKARIKALAGQDAALGKVNESMEKNRKKLSELTQGGKGASAAADTLRAKIKNQEQTVRELTEQMKNGNGILEAQKIILAELAVEFGGSAKAAGDAQTPMERLRLKFGEIQEEIGAKLLPVLNDFADWILEEGIPLASRLGTSVKNAFDDVVRAVQFVVDKVLAAFEWIARGQAAAFGWLPWGDKLRQGAKDIEKFRDEVNAALEGIRDKKVVLDFDTRIPSAKMPGQPGYIAPLRPGEAGPPAPGQGRSAGPVVYNNNITMQKGANEQETARAISWQGRRHR